MGIAPTLKRLFFLPLSMMADDINFNLHNWLSYVSICILVFGENISDFRLLRRVGDTPLSVIKRILWHGFLNPSLSMMNPLRWPHVRDRVNNKEEDWAGRKKTEESPQEKSIIFEPLVVSLMWWSKNDSARWCFVYPCSAPWEKFPQTYVKGSP